MKYGAFLYSFWKWVVYSVGLTASAIESPAFAPTSPPTTAPTALPAGPAAEPIAAPATAPVIAPVPEPMLWSFLTSLICCSPALGEPAPGGAGTSTLGRQSYSRGQISLNAGVQRSVTNRANCSPVTLAAAGAMPVRKRVARGAPMPLAAPTCL